MNIFVLDKDPQVAAIYHCDKHVVKMILETAQLLSTTHRLTEVSPDQSLYRVTHKNHPSAIWVREGVQNYLWAYRLFCHLCDEYTHRYGKTHLTDSKLRKLLGKIPSNLPGGSTNFKLAMKSNPECMKECPVESYRSYYRTKKTKFSMVWSHRPTPPWW